MTKPHAALRDFVRAGGTVIVRFALPTAGGHLVVTKEFEFNDPTDPILYTAQSIDSLLREGAGEVMAGEKE